MSVSIHGGQVPVLGPVELYRREHPELVSILHLASRRGVPGEQALRSAVARVNLGLDQQLLDAAGLGIGRETINQLANQIIGDGPILATVPNGDSYRFDEHVARPIDLLSEGDRGDAVFIAPDEHELALARRRAHRSKSSLRLSLPDRPYNIRPTATLEQRRRPSCGRTQEGVLQLSTIGKSRIAP